MKLRTPVSGKPRQARAEFPLGNFTLLHGEISLSTQPVFARRMISGFATAAQSRSAHCINEFVPVLFVPVLVA